MSNKNTLFNLDCRACPRLASHLDQVRRDFPDYHARPVESFGTKKPELLIVGLAPGMHGANATGRPFTGDYAGILLYETLHKYRFSNKPESRHRNDGLTLKNCRITNAVKCLPPANKPTGDEIKICNQFLKAEIDSLKPKIILALGKIAHDAVLKSRDMKLSAYKFGHAQTHPISNSQTLIDSYHCSRYNTQTRRLTEDMFHNVFEIIQQHLEL